MRRVRASYSGRVQGVGFRATARSLAGRAGVTGWVRNEPDGSVSLEAQGEPAQVDAFLTTLRDRMGRLIETRKISDVDPVDDEPSFDVRQ